MLFLDFKKWILAFAISFVIAVAITIFYFKLPLNLSSINKVIQSVKWHQSSHGNSFFSDFNNSYHTFNTIYFPDDRGNNFWEYDPVTYESKLTGSRRIDLKVNEEIFLIVPRSRSSRVILYPENAITFNKVSELSATKQRIYEMAVKASSASATDKDLKALLQPHSGSWLLFFTSDFHSSTVSAHPEIERFALLSSIMGQWTSAYLKGLVFQDGHFNASKKMGFLDDLIEARSRSLKNTSLYFREVCLVGYKLVSVGVGRRLLRTDYCLPKDDEQARFHSDVVVESLSGISFYRPSIANREILVEVRE